MQNAATGRPGTAGTCHITNFQFDPTPAVLNVCSCCAHAADSQETLMPRLARNETTEETS